MAGTAPPRAVIVPRGMISSQPIIGKMEANSQMAAPRRKSPREW